MMNINEFFSRKYDATFYNCGHFVIEVWEFLTGEDISLCATSFQTRNIKDYRDYHIQRQRIKKPNDPCLVVMRSVDAVPHVGIFVEGRVLHIGEDGVRFDRIPFLKNTYKLTYFK